MGHQGRRGQLSGDNKPCYELLAKNHGPDDLELSLWQLPCPATPHIACPLRIGGLRGRNLSLVEGHVLKILRHAGIRLTPPQAKAANMPWTKTRP